MKIPSKYFHDKTILLLLTVNLLLAIAITLWVLLHFGGADHSGVYVTQKRVNLGLNAFKFGGFVNILAFIVFGLFTFGFHTLVSIRVYTLRRALSVVVLGSATLLLGLAFIVSDLLVR